MDRYIPTYITVIVLHNPHFQPAHPYYVFPIAINVIGSIQNIPSILVILMSCFLYLCCTLLVAAHQNTRPHSHLIVAYVFHG